VSGDETELLQVLLAGMDDGDVEETVRAINDAPPEKPAGRRRRRASRPSTRPGRRAAHGDSAPV
jgi:hypothetical protein